MSCSSPFVYQVATEIKTDTQTVGCSGSYTLQSYTAKWGGGSWCTGCSDTKSKWSGWRNWDLKTDTKWNDCCWGIDYPTWTIELWPTITFAGNVSIPFVFESQEGVQITVDAPEGEPYQAQSITLNTCNLLFGIDSENITLNIIPTPIEIEEENGEFSINIPLQSFDSKKTEFGVTYKLTLDTELQFCLDPTPPVGWINLVISCTLSVKEDIDGLDFETKTTFEVSCPIVSVEEE